MKSAKSLCIFLLLKSYCSGFNIAPDPYYKASLPQTFRSDRASYFGYSSAILKTGKKSWLLVGAPRANSSSNRYESGTLFKCNLKSKFESCQQVELEKSYSSLIDKRTYSTHPITNNAWAGASIDIDNDGNVIVCAPRYNEEYRMNGLCYVIGSDLNEHTDHVLAPLSVRAKRNWETNKGNVVAFFAHGGLGMAMHLTKNLANSKEQILLLGAPGILNWHGSVVWMKQESIKMGGSRKRRSTSNFYSKHRIPNPYFTSVIESSDSFGYSVSSGHFSSKSIIHFVAGAPRGNSGKGMVLVFKIQEKSDILDIKAEKSGRQLGEYFGSSLAAPDLNGDGYSDLVVGAPLHSSSSNTDNGCVYVYMNDATKPGTLSVKGIQLLGNAEKGARFGSAIGVPGDMNNDGFEDIVVGAPYENSNTGAVYVYLGSKTGIKTDYSQKLTPESLKLPLLKGLGISFSKPVDIDGNKYPDFAIGSYLSDEAVVMTTIPVITIKASLGSNPKKLNLNATGFTLISCVSYRGIHVPPSTTVTSKISLHQKSEDGTVVASFDNGRTEEIKQFTLTRKKKRCQDIQVHIAELKNKESHQAKVNNPIIIEMEFPAESNEYEKAVLDPFSKFVAPYMLSFINGCNKDICKADLFITILSIMGLDEDEILMVGDVGKITLEIIVANRRDPAYLPSLYLAIPDDVTVFPSSFQCTPTKIGRKNDIECQLKSPLERNIQQTIKLEFDVSALDDSSPDLVFKLNVSSSADSEVNPDDNEKEIMIKLAKEVELKIFGWSIPDANLYDFKHKVGNTLDGYTSFQQVFSISKTGATPVGEIQITMEFPTSFQKEGKTHVLLTLQKHKVEFHGNTLTCSVRKPIVDDAKGNKLIPLKKGQMMNSLNCSSVYLECSKIICKLRSWNKKSDIATVTADFNVSLASLSHIISLRKGAALTSIAKANILSLNNVEYFKGNEFAMVNITTQMHPASMPAQPLSWWIHGIAVCAGILLLIVLSYVLYKVGFFKRKSKNQMIKSQRANLIPQEQEQEQWNKTNGKIAIAQEQ